LSTNEVSMYFMKRVNICNLLTIFMYLNILHVSVLFSEHPCA